MEISFTTFCVILVFFDSRYSVLDLDRRMGRRSLVLRALLDVILCPRTKGTRFHKAEYLNGQQRGPVSTKQNV